MIHGPCGTFNPHAPCMKNGTCSAGHPKAYQPFTTMDQHSYPRYCHCNTVTMKSNNTSMVFISQLLKLHGEFSNFLSMTNIPMLWVLLFICPMNNVSSSILPRMRDKLWNMLKMLKQASLHSSKPTEPKVMSVTLHAASHTRSFHSILSSKTMKTTSDQSIGLCANEKLLFLVGWLMLPQ